jgi:hypothetical protein
MSDTTEAESHAESDGTTRQFRVGETRPGGPPDHPTGEPVCFPLEETLRGRTFICGKSGSGKSNSASVLIEKILDAGRPLFIIDVEGEYYGLKEQYEVLHAGADELCDIQVGPEHADKLAQLSIQQGVPIILDLSGFLDEDEADSLVGAVGRALFATAKEAREPFPVFVEECHEFLPEQGSAGETGKAFVRISKRGRKHGLGLVGISQRPASVDKDFITQCNILIWHRLTWDRDTRVVRDVLGGGYANEIPDLADGEAFLNVDPDVLDATSGVVADTLRVQFERKQTYDAGEAPGLGDESRPELQSVDQGLVEELQSISDREQRRQDAIERLRSKVESRDERIEELEDELADTKDIRGIMDDMVGSIAGHAGSGDTEASTTTGEREPVTVTVEGTDLEVPEVIQTEVMEIREDRRDAKARVEELETAHDRQQRAAEHLAARLADRPTSEDVEALRQFAAEFGELTDRHADVVGDYAGVSAGENDDTLARLRERARTAEERAEELEAEREAARSDGEEGEVTAGSAGGTDTLGAASLADADLTTLLRHEAIQTAIQTAAERGSPAEQHYGRVLSVLASAGNDEYRSASDVATLLDVSDATVREVLKGLHTANVVTREAQGRGHTYALDRDLLEQRIEVAEQQAAIAGKRQASEEGGDR